MHKHLFRSRHTFRQGFLIFIEGPVSGNLPYLSASAKKIRHSPFRHSIEEKETSVFQDGRKRRQMAGMGAQSRPKDCQYRRRFLKARGPLGRTTLCQISVCSANSGAAYLCRASRFKWTLTCKTTLTALRRPSVVDLAVRQSCPSVQRNQIGVLNDYNADKAATSIDSDR